METKELVVAFDLLEAGFKQWDFVKHGFIFLFIGLVMEFGPKLLPKISQMIGQLFDPNGKQKIMAKWMPKFFIGFSALWIASVFSATYTGYNKLVEAYDTGQFEVAEGVVADFVPMPRSGHASEKFTVGAASFSYSDFLSVPGFNNTKSHGGPLDEGVFVRVSYVGNSIIRLEVEPSAMVGKVRNRSDSLGDIAEDQEPYKVPFEPFLAFSWYVAQTFLVLSISYNWHKASRAAAMKNATARQAHGRLLSQFLLFGLAPIVVGLLIYLAINGSVTNGSHKVSSGIVYTLNTGALLYLNYWIQIKGGARWIAGQPGFIDHIWVIRVYAVAPLLLFVGPAFKFVGSNIYSLFIP